MTLKFAMITNSGRSSDWRPFEDVLRSSEYLDMTQLVMPWRVERDLKTEIHEPFCWRPDALICDLITEIHMPLGLAT